MKRITIGIVLLATLAAAAAYGAYPDEFVQYATEALTATIWVWESIKANPVPASLAVGSFLLTVLYHKARGKSLRESVEVAATRVAVVPVQIEAPPAENPVVKRARARTTRTQLLADQIGLQTRQRRLPEEIVKAQKEAMLTKQGVADAERKLGERRKAHELTVARLEALRKDQAACDAELAEIEAELQRLAELV